MSCVKIMTAPSQTLTANSATYKYVWFTAWMPAIAMDAGSAVVKIKNLANAFRLKPAYQTAECRIDLPDAPVAVGTAQDADGEVFFGESVYDLDSVTPGKGYIRFGVAVYVASTPNFGSADVAFSLSCRQCGAMLAPWSGHVVATSTTPIYVPISAFMAAMGVKSLQAIVVLNGLSGAIEVALAYRKASASGEKPAAWADWPSTPAYTTDNTELNTGELPITITDAMLIQLGIRFKLTEAGSPGQADVTVMPAVRSSG